MYGIQSQERRYHYSGIAVPVCWNGGAIPAGIFSKKLVFQFNKSANYDPHFIMSKSIF